MAFDLVIITWAIAVSGGSQSVLYPWVLTNVVAAAFYAGRRGLLVVMAADIVAYLMVVGVTVAFVPGILLGVLAGKLILFGGAGYALLAIFRLQEKRRVITELQTAEVRRGDELEAAIATIAAVAAAAAQTSAGAATVEQSAREVAAMAEELEAGPQRI